MKRIIILILLIALFICGCDAGYNRYSAGATDYYDAIYVVEKHVPYPQYLDLRLDYVELLETDEYGRNLFCYKVVSSRTKIFLILQKTEEMFTYYYEDDCYAFTQFDSDISEQEMNALKERNDWGKPINQEKMVRISYTREDVIKDTINIRDVEENLSNYLSENPICKKMKDFYFNPLDFCFPNKQLMLICERHKDYSQHYFLVLYDHDSEQPVVEIEELQGMNSFREEIIAFKEQHGLISAPKTEASDE